MTTYICKCGRIERKSTNADTTGNRDTADCKGCPYLLPYGKHEYIQDKGYQLKVEGYECRMSKSLEYGSGFGGSVTDKCVCYVASLDFDFLEQISGWIKATYPGGELSGVFDRDNVRAAEYSSNGRCRYSIYCAQNKAGMAAKAALLERFFHPDGSRKDMTPEDEKQKILQDIENGKLVTLRQDLPEVPAESSPAPVVETMPAPAAEAMPAPAFDYGGLDAQTVEYLHIAEREYAQGKVWAERGLRRMADGVAIAHEALCGSCDNLSKLKYGNRGENTFGAWCASIGISRKAAERLLQVSKLYGASTPSQQGALEELSPSLLYAAARPSAPAELVAQVKSGDITSHKQYQELLAKLKTAERRVSDVEQELDNLISENDDYDEKFGEMREELKKKDEAIKRAQKAADDQRLRAAEAEKALNEASQMRDAWRSRAEKAEQAAAPSEEQIARWRDEGAEGMAAELDAVREQLDRSAAKLHSAKNEANRLRETLEGRTDHLNAVEAELKALKTELRQARDAAKTAAAPSLPAAMPAEPKLVLCDDCIFSPICCGISLFAPDDLGEGTLAQFREEELDEDAFDRRLLGCTAGITKESR